MGVVWTSLLDLKMKFLVSGNFNEISRNLVTMMHFGICLVDSPPKGLALFGLYGVKC